MLTKDLQRYRIVKGFVRPQFVRTDDEALRQFAGQLLAVYSLNGSPSRSEIAESAEPLINTWKDLKLAKGLNKLLQDRCEFRHETANDVAELRHRVFAVSAALLRQSHPGYDDYCRMMTEHVGVAAEALHDRLYADLPENERLSRFKELDPGQLLERYNCSLVQSLLLQARSLTLRVVEPEAAKLRRMIKYLKFFRLLARIYAEDAGVAAANDLGATRLRFEVDGPASMFENTHKYGLQLASFFPAVCDLAQWQLDTEVFCRSRQVRLSLNETSGLVGHYRNFSTYVPEEVRMFHRRFKETVTDWAIVGETPFMDAGDQELIFPDVSFRHQSGTTVHLELFHRWHASQLVARLAYVEAHPEQLLILGVDRYLANKPEISEALDASSGFGANGFLFRDYPAVVRVRSCLDSRRTDFFPGLG